MQYFVLVIVVLCGAVVNCCWAPPQTTTSTAAANLLDTCGTSNTDPILNTQTAMNLVGVANQQMSSTLTYTPAPGTNAKITCYTLTDTLKDLGQASTIKITSGGVGYNFMSILITSQMGQGYAVTMVVRGKP